MNLELFIAKKIHFSKEGDREVTPPAVRIAMIGIALGLAVMILSVAIVIGFKKEVRNKVIGFGSHIQITNFDSNSSYESQPIAVSDTLLNALDAFPGIRHVEKFATKLGILKTDQDFQGIVLKGVDTDYDWTFFKDFHSIYTISFDSINRIHCSTTASGLYRLSASSRAYLPIFFSFSQS